MATARPPQPTVEAQRTVAQMCTPTGEPYPGYATQFVWVSEADPYPKTDGNLVKPLFSGEEYFAQLADAIEKANKTIYMLGWQINWDVQLKPGLRLYDAFRNAALTKPDLKIYVLPWDDSDKAVNTLDEETCKVLQLINQEIKGPARVFAHIAVELPDPSAGWDMYFSHHQKQVVIDEKIAFIGGLDVAYGRRDGPTYPLDGAGREGSDFYNNGVPALKTVKVGNEFVNGAKVKTPADLNAPVPLKPKHELPIQGTERGVMPANHQPRMPWQDIHLRIEGPAVSHLATNFVLRWNCARKKTELRLPPPPSPNATAGTCSVQMLRSASHVMVATEAKYAHKDDQARLHTKFGHNHIHHAMVRLIENAEHFIYIENQFYVSAFGAVQFYDDGKTIAPPKEEAITSVKDTINRWAVNAPPGTGRTDLPPTNLINEALGAKFRSMIMDGSSPPPDGKQSRFHVYITLPVNPEGSLGSETIMTQVHYTMQSLVFGRQSLLNRIRRAIKARQLKDKKDAGYERAFRDDNTEYRDVPYDYCWPYVTLLNLRTWGKFGTGKDEHYVTEQIYIHSKLMVVDDRYALVGSANINDRSQIGDRDSEIAVLIMDNDFSYTDIGSPDGPDVTRKLARELRMGVWNKIFGNMGGERPAGLKDAIEKPAAQKSWEAIRDQAEKNTANYESAFSYIPRNNASIWPSVTWKSKTPEGKRDIKVGLMPFDRAFWAQPRHNPKGVAGLSSVKGYITLLPWLWTAGENNNGGMHSALFVQKDNSKSPIPGEPSLTRTADARLPNEKVTG
ncbi:phospholipase D-like domain-containing protein [Viridibacterium curvum]|uniref:PLD phosphodiesterase domain-containing protein n=1 Tax=Viridibacterium curvum TaxID=1101404 RepID=A0ABP9QJB9_9RHOO